MTDYIYESPDGGRTVYRRAFNATEREIIFSTPDDWDSVVQKQNWTQLAQQYPAIEDKLRELLMLKKLVADVND